MYRQPQQRNLLPFNKLSPTYLSSSAPFLRNGILLECLLVFASLPALLASPASYISQTLTWAGSMRYYRDQFPEGCENPGGGVNTQGVGVFKYRFQIQQAMRC
eukprot:765887-Hanusia_phi.AAC.2